MISIVVLVLLIVETTCWMDRPRGMRSPAALVFEVILFLAEKLNLRKPRPTRTELALAGLAVAMAYGATSRSRNRAMAILGLSDCVRSENEMCDQIAMRILDLAEELGPK